MKRPPIETQTVAVTPPCQRRRIPGLRAFLLGWLVATTTLVPASLFAQDNDSAGSASKLRTSRQRKDIYLETQTGVLVGVEGYAGLATLAMDHQALGHVYGGGILRLRFSGLELGGFGETSSYDGTKWRMVGGTVGTFLPFGNWVDIDAAAGFAYRTYVSLDQRYGAAGAHVTMPAVVFRVGVSERLTEGTLAPRLGGSLFTGIDLSRESAHWNYEVGDDVLDQGNARFGGITIGIMMNAGFDLALGQRS